MPLTRDTAEVDNDLTLTATFRKPLSGAVFNPSSVTMVEILDTDADDVLQTIQAASISNPSTGVYSVNSLAANYDVGGTYYDRWTYKETADDPVATTTLSTVVKDTTPAFKSRQEAVVDTNVMLFIEYRKAADNTLFDPNSVDKVEILNSGGAVLETIVGAGIVKHAVGIYYVIASGSKLSAVGTYTDKWTATLTPGAGATENTFTFDVQATVSSVAVTPTVTIADRQYTYKTALSAAKVDLTGLSDNDIRDLVAAASQYVETLTDQVFCPIVDAARKWVSHGRSIAYDPQLLPILETSSLKIDYDVANYRDDVLTSTIYDTVYTKERAALISGLYGARTLTTADYVIAGRYVEMISGLFPGGPKGSIVVDGVFGWLDPIKAKVSTTLSADLVTDATSIAVVSAAGFDKRDVILVDNRLYAVVTAVSAATNTLTVDGIGTLPATISRNKSVVTWGKVPRQIQDLTTYLVNEFLGENTARDNDVRFIDPSRLKKEVTDRYSYELFPTASSGGSITGSIRHDMAIRRFSRPASAVAI